MQRNLQRGIWLVAALGLFSVGCWKDYIVLKAAAIQDSDAASLLGRAIQNKNGSDADPQTVFSVPNAPVKPVTGTETWDSSLTAGIGVMAVHEFDVCQVQGVGAITVSNVKNKTIQQIAEISPPDVSWVWKVPPENPCCVAGGGVTDACKKLGVITAIYKSQTTSTGTTEFTGSGEVTCGSAVMKAKLVGGGTVEGLVEGWSVVRVLKMADVCRSMH